jgi:hypothetical protein
VPLGSLTLARIDLWEVGDRYFDVLDAESSEWAAYIDIVEPAGDELRFLLIVDRVELVPWARGHDIGLHVVARAIRTWGDEALVALTAYPPGARGGIGKAGAKALSRHWSRLGLEQVKGSDPPILTGDGNSRELDDTIRKLSAWHPPTPTER